MTLQRSSVLVGKPNKQQLTLNPIPVQLFLPFEIQINYISKSKELHCDLAGKRFYQVSFLRTNLTQNVK